MNFPLQSWVDALEVGSEVNYHFSMGTLPAVVDEITEFSIWLLCDQNGSSFLAKIGKDGCGPYSSFIAPRT